MRSYKAVVIFFVFSQLLGCGNQLVGFPDADDDSTAPTVISTAPASGETDVAINLSVSATFSEEMDPASISGSTFTLYDGATPVAGAVSYAGYAASFDPTDNLEGGTVYTATITTGAADPAGNNLVADYVWNFTTGSSADTTPPTVISTIPVDDATDVVINASLTATFSEAMNPATISDSTFTLFDGTTPVAGAVSLVGATATFNPTTDLEVDTLYTGTITIGAADLAGNALAADYVWSFTTGAAADVTPPTVILTSPLDLAIDVAINTNVTATFSEAMDALTITDLTFTLLDGTTPVPGAVTYVGLTATFNPTADLVIDTEYTATITTVAEDLAGNALVADYVWSFTTTDGLAPTVISTIPMDAAIDVATDTDVSATFSEAMDTLTITDATFTLFDGLTPVSGAVTYAGVTATFNPTADLDSETVYTATITTGAEDLGGSPMAADYVWSFTIEDLTAPYVVSTIPTDEAIDVAVDSNVSAAFNEVMNGTTITDVTFTLLDGTTPVPGAVTYAGVTATFNPTADLAPETEYTATITAAAEDLAGNPMAADYVWSFTTMETTPPTIISTFPVDGEQYAAVDTDVTATFSETMDELTITDLTFTVLNGVTPVVGDVSYLGVTATFDPIADLEPGVVYTATITVDATDLAGNPLAPGLVPNPWTFTVDPGPVIVIDLGLAESFAIAATAGVTNTPTAPLTHINGDVVLDPLDQCNAVVVDGAGGFGLCDGSAPTIDGIVITNTYPDTTTSTAVKADLNAAFLFITPPAGPPAVGSLAGGTPLAAPTTMGNVTGSALVLGDNYFTPGVYISDTSILISDDITLDGGGDPNAIFIFQSASSLTTADGAPGTYTRILLTGGTQAKNVWWQVASSATIGLYSEFQGNILAAFDITMKTYSTACGRSMAGAWVGGAGAFVFDSNVVSVPGSCP
ncbi:MAG: Ig-like domain-containing protein [Proteobacteria bacterium]|jgi:hypothetical protein|nr:Ig-like domain-containing protein [Pseudomonadota bacterium]